MLIDISRAEVRFRPTRADTGLVSAGQPCREEVIAFLDRQPGSPECLEALTGGAWSSAWAYRAGGEELVVRFGQEVSWYEADRMAMAFGGPDLPVPEIREVGTTPSGRAYAISVRHHGRFLEDTPVEQARAIAPTLTRLLVALYRVPSDPDAPVLWHQAAGSAASWREFLLAGLVDDPGKLVHGWSAALAGDQELAALSAAVTERVRALAEACPERRDLVHGDLLHGNVLVSPDATGVEAVLSWKCSVRGDFLFDAAWCSFWAPFHPGIAAADPLSGLLGARSVRAGPGALLDAAARHHCYELCIGFTHLGWNVWTGDQASLAATARRLAEVFERGPLPLTGA
jgi:aminoglycoside phosphotransferase (APT) family kinase protein